MDDKTVRAIKHIAAFRSRKGQGILDTIYGPRALPLRTAVAALLLNRKVTGSDKAAQYGSLRQMLLLLTGATGDCKAAEDTDFEAKAERVLS